MKRIEIEKSFVIVDNLFEEFDGRILKIDVVVVSVDRRMKDFLRWSQVHLIVVVVHVAVVVVTRVVVAVA